MDIKKTWNKVLKYNTTLNLSINITMIHHACLLFEVVPYALNLLKTFQ